MRGIIVYEKKAAEYNRSYIEQYVKEGKAIGLEITLVYYEDIVYGVQGNRPFVQAPGIDFDEIRFAIYRCRDAKLSEQLELINLAVFNSSYVCAIGNDKARTYQYLSQFDIPMIDSLFVKNAQLASLLAARTEPAVVKAVHGHGGSQVCLYHPEEKNEQIQEILRVMDGEDVVVQPFVKGRQQDLRVYVIGNKVVAAVLRSAKEDFRANYSLGGSVQLYTLSEKELRVVDQILAHIRLDYAGIDFLIGEEGQLIFNEIEDVVGARMLYQCSEVNVVALYLTHIVSVLEKTV